MILIICAGLVAACGSENSSSPATATATTRANRADQAVTTGQATVTVEPLPSSTPLPLPTVTPSPVPPSPTVRVATTAAMVISPGPPVAGDLPAPVNARKLNLSPGVLQRLQKQIGGRYAAADTGALATAVYASPDFPADIFDYYRAAMKAKGWTESQAYDNRFGVYFVKGTQVAAVGAIAIPDDSTVTFLAGFVPEIKGQLQAGESLVALAQGPARSFEAVLKK